MSRTSISVNDLAQELDIPTATLRRYLRQHGHFLDVNKTHKNYMIAEESIGILKQIREGYSQGLISEEVDSRLLASGVQRKTSAVVEQSSNSNNINFIEALLNLEKRMVERFEQQGEILQNLAEIAPALQQFDPDIQRVERVNSRLNEWRIERKLEDDAMMKWAELPRPDRMIRTGLFKTEENLEKRERFVREYVDKHFDNEMRNAYGV
jgi:hypothetical protein